MNKLSLNDRVAVVRALVEGNSLRATSRITGIAYNTVLKLLVDVGEACEKFHNETVKDIPSRKVQCDEIWSFVYCKDKAVDYCTKKEEQHVGDTWTWVGIDADTKLVVSWFVGDRDAIHADIFMYDVASRLRNRVQLTTDGHREYLVAVEEAFDDEIDYARLIKTYGATDENDSERKYSPPTCTGIKKVWVSGDPCEADISTSYIERQNLTMRMQMRRFTRLTNGFSKKKENHNYAIALHYVHYNFVRAHKTLRCTPAMAAKLTDRFMTIEDIVRMAYADEIEAENKRLARRYRAAA